MLIAAERLFRDGALTGPGAVAIADGRIVAVLDYHPIDADIVLPGILAPGLIDLHNNGAFGIDCATADIAGFRHLCIELARRGVTSFLPTIITAPIPTLHEAAGRIQAAMVVLEAEPMARMIGLHLEGPFLSPARRGAHRAEWLRVPDEEALDALMADAALAVVLRLVTLAPELRGALAAISRFAKRDVAVALGHTDADAATAQAAIEAGATLATHVFTAMRPFHHRDPGIVGAALADPRLAACFIADAVHADPLALRLGFAAAGTRAVAVTDSVSLAGLAEGSTTEFGGAPATVRDGAARRPDGTLTGATISLDEGLRRLIAAGIPAEAVLTAATEAPAQAIGLTDRGRLAPGLRADLVWFDDAFAVRNSWIGGIPTAPLQPTRHPVLLPLTETSRADAIPLDQSGSEAVIAALLDQEARAQAALRHATPALARLADLVALRLEAGGRLFYAGAGTSGRLAVLDAVECGPTFSLPPGVIVPLIAGGAVAIADAVEGAEDDADAAVAVLKSHGVGPADALIGIAASGATPFTLAAIRAARAAGALTAGLANSDGPIVRAAEIGIVIASGAEVLAGSTRLSAGTTQKIALNALSTTIMIRLGKVFGPYMVDMRPSNAKLRGRAVRIVADIAGCDRAAAEAALEACGYEVKTAIVMLTRGEDAESARARLGHAHGRLRAALEA
ncbi:MAG: N-acetylglucosamine-6-phosphate deacetylase [Acidiphilium sp.]